MNIWAVAVASTLIVILISLVVRKIIKDTRELPTARARLKDLNSAYLHLKESLNDDAEYFRFSKLKKITSDFADLKKQVAKVRNIHLHKEKRNLLREVNAPEDEIHLGS